MTRAFTGAWAALALAVAACGGEEPPPVTGPAKEAAATVLRLDRATARRDFVTVCDKLLTAEARRRAGGQRCAARMRRRAAGIRRPRIEIVRIERRGHHAAIVRVRVHAIGQPVVTDTVDLVRQGPRLRIASLGD